MLHFTGTVSDDHVKASLVLFGAVNGCKLLEVVEILRPQNPTIQACITLARFATPTGISDSIHLDQASGGSQVIAFEHPKTATVRIVGESPELLTLEVTLTKPRKGADPEIITGQIKCKIFA